MAINKRIYIASVLVVINLFLCITLSAQKLDFEKFIVTINQLEKEGEFEKALDYLNIHRNNHPDKYFELSKEEIYINEKLQKFEENLKVFMAGHEKGYFYFIHPDIPKFKPYKELAGFKSISENDIKLRERALLKSKIIYDIELPKLYSEDRLWPICLIFHGGGSNLEKVQEHWHSDKFNSGFIKIYFQSYRHYDSKTFGWTSGDERSDKQLSELFNEILNNYSIDTTKILVCGISAGGTYAIDISMRQVVPVARFIAFCPGIPKILGTEHLPNIQELKVKGFMIGGTKDYYLPQQKQMSDVFNQLNISFKHIVIENMEHQYPDDESKWIDEALVFFNTIKSEN